MTMTMRVACAATLLMAAATATAREESFCPIGRGGEGGNFTCDGPTPLCCGANNPNPTCMKKDQKCWTYGAAQRACDAGSEAANRNWVLPSGENVQSLVCCPKGFSSCDARVVGGASVGTCCPKGEGCCKANDGAFYCCPAGTMCDISRGFGCQPQG